MKTLKSFIKYKIFTISVLMTSRGFLQHWLKCIKLFIFSKPLFWKYKWHKNKTTMFAPLNSQNTLKPNVNIKHLYFKGQNDLNLSFTQSEACLQKHEQKKFPKYFKLLQQNKLTHGYNSHQHSWTSLTTSYTEYKTLTWGTEFYEMLPFCSYFSIPPKGIHTVLQLSHIW